MYIRCSFFLFLSTLLLSCGEEEGHDTLFVKLNSSITGISFNNTFEEDQELNVMSYEYLYNGGGVGIGDFNNDQLPDIYLTGNVVENKLYLNRGDMRFEDITSQAGVAGRKSWTTGVSVADVNGDGLLDIYVCHSGPTKDRANELFINQGLNKNGIPVFSEQAQHFGLDAPGTLSTQAAFFDYDLDGDLDMFLLNHARIVYSSYANVDKLRSTRHPEFGNRLYRNDNNRFIDVSAEAGIFGGGINFGLGIVVSDINLDRWPDVYVTNDYEEKDFLYLNNKDGTFSDITNKAFDHLSKFSMGLDIADINNDFLPDVMTLDMLPKDNHRLKLLKGPDEYDKYQLAVRVGYHHQNMRNMLHLNIRAGLNDNPVFSEIGQLAGVSNTDWSWSALLADYDNDGLKDLFVSNGYVRDYTNMDFLNYEVAEAMEEARSQGRDISTTDSYRKNMPLKELVQKMPSTKISNYVFRNTNGLEFNDMTIDWGFKEPMVSTGAAYADLDNDGDLDLIVSNSHAPAGVYENTSANTHYLMVRLKGGDRNPFGLGAKIYVKSQNHQQYREAYPVRGYQSSVDNMIHFGLGVDSIVHEVRILWPGTDSLVTVSQNITSNQVFIGEQSKASKLRGASTNERTPFFSDISDRLGLEFTHTENDFVDFKYEPLLISQQSRLGPCLTRADVNEDGLEDFFVGGASGQAGRLFLQTLNGFTEGIQHPWQIDSLFEDVACEFLDADGDGKPDLYVASGGNEFRDPRAFQARIYRNMGAGRFNKTENALPRHMINTGATASADYDKDGDVDLFIGGGSIPGRYPMPTSSTLLINDTGADGTSEIRFSLLSGDQGNLFQDLGLVRDASWVDIDDDSWLDLVVVGDWMPITIYKNHEGVLEKLDPPSLKKSNGFWKEIEAGDFDNDGDIDFIVGNLGRNTQIKCSPSEPLQLYAFDFNTDGRVDPILCMYYDGVSYPVHSKDELTSQMNYISKKFLKYADFADARIEDIVGAELLKESSVYEVFTTETSLLENLGDHTFELSPLPVNAQFSVVHGIVVDDFNEDGNLDVFISGNFFPFRAEFGQSDAGAGELFLGKGTGEFTPVSREQLGVLVKGDVRGVVSIEGAANTLYVVAKNNDKLQILRETQ